MSVDLTDQETAVLIDVLAPAGERFEVAQDVLTKINSLMAPAVVGLRIEAIYSDEVDQHPPVAVPTGDMTPDAIGAAFLAVYGGPPRSADLAVLEMTGKGASEVAEYIWDHMLGEPEQPTQRAVLLACLAAMEAFPV